MKKIVWASYFVLLLLIPFEETVFASGVSESSQRFGENQNTIIWVMAVFLIVVVINAILLVLANFSLNNSDSPDNIFFLPFLKKSSKKSGELLISGTVELKGGQIQKFAKVYLMDQDDEIIANTTAKADGIFNFSTKSGSYIISSRGFGYDTVAKRPLEIGPKDKNTLTKIEVKNIEAVKANAQIISFISTNRFIWIIISLVAAVSYLLSIQFLNTTISIDVLVIFIVSLLVLFSSTHHYLIIRDHNGNPISKTKFEILNSSNSKLSEATTDSRGRLKIVASSGIYKLKSDNHLSGSFSVSQRSIVDLVIRL